MQDTNPQVKSPQQQTEQLLARSRELKERSKQTSEKLLALQQKAQQMQGPTADK